MDWYNLRNNQALVDLNYPPPPPTPDERGALFFFCFSSLPPQTSWVHPWNLSEALLQSESFNGSNTNGGGGERGWSTFYRTLNNTYALFTRSIAFALCRVLCPVFFFSSVKSESSPIWKTTPTHLLECQKSSHSLAYFCFHDGERRCETARDGERQRETEKCVCVSPFCRFKSFLSFFSSSHGAWRSSFTCDSVLRVFLSSLARLCCDNATSWSILISGQTDGRVVIMLTETCVGACCCNLTSHWCWSIH